MSTYGLVQTDFPPVSLSCGLRFWLVGSLHLPSFSLQPDELFNPIASCQADVVQQRARPSFTHRATRAATQHRHLHVLQGGQRGNEVMKLEDEADRRGPVLSRVFFFQAEDGIRDLTVTGVQTCALPI